MKKLLAILLVAALVFTCAGCDIHAWGSRKSADDDGVGPDAIVTPNVDEGDYDDFDPIDANGEPEDAIDESETPNELSDGTIVGGWVVPEDGAITEELAEIFRQAIADSHYGEDELEPVSCVGKQIVAGTNYAFLCRRIDIENDKSEVTDDADADEPVAGISVTDVIVYVHETLNDEVYFVNSVTLQYSSLPESAIGDLFDYEAAAKIG